MAEFVMCMDQEATTCFMAMFRLPMRAAAIEQRLVSESPHPELAILDREKMLRVHRAVSSLSYQQRQCLYLRAEGFRYREIAEILDVASSTVGEFLQRAIIRLRKALYE